MNVSSRPPLLALTAALGLVLFGCLGACSPTPEPSPGSDTGASADTLDTAADAPPDTVDDAAADVIADTAPDAFVDVAGDTPDVPADAAMDTGDDAGTGPTYTLITDPGHVSDTSAQLAEFYAAYGGRDAFPADHVRAIEGMLAADDAAARGGRTAAGEAVEAVFSVQPRAGAGWDASTNVGHAGSNTGHPVAYYGLRMLEQIAALDPSAGGSPLIMTAVVAPCAVARVPQPVGMGPLEGVEIDLDPAILADGARRLFVATSLFRRWVQAITGGVALELQVYVLDGCSTVDFTDDGATVVSYPDAGAMVEAVHPDVANATDFWWVVTPSGIRNEERELGRHTITGGMGASSDGAPLLLSDDRWFVQKPNHLGEGRWLEAELRTYHPQWFQHEFMHHLFARWPEFGLESEGHQWFTRSLWPEDFEGTFEPDYYAEAITKRLLTATPSLAEGLRRPDFLSFAVVGTEGVVGAYRREPVENGYHEVTVGVVDGALVWSNAANVSWSLVERDGALVTGPDCPYGEVELAIEGEGGEVSALWFQERYVRVE